MAIHAPLGDNHDHIASKNKINPASISNPKGSQEKIQKDGSKNQLPSITPMEATYTSLIQQYLSLLCFENATFLAERMVAHCPTKHSFYLLATCYYRMGQVKRAYSVLVRSGGSSDSSSGSSSSSSNRSINQAQIKRKDDMTTNPNNSKHDSGNIAARFLLAKCCCDLDLLDEAEECLLQRVGRFGWTNGKKKKGDNLKTDGETDSFTEWILSDPCPIPNGAAGLHLLGVICRKSNRKKQAAKYFSLSLKLDPMMWTSFEALCSMGFVDSTAKSNGIHMDPISIFGVTPPALQPISNQEEAQQQQVSKPDEFPYPETNILGHNNNNTTNMMSPDFNISTQKPDDVITPPSSAPLDLSYNTPIHPSVKRTHSEYKLHYTSRKYSVPAGSTLFSDIRPDVDVSNLNNISAIPNISSEGPKSNSRKNQGRGNYTAIHSNPSTMFETPNLTPIKFDPVINQLNTILPNNNPTQEMSQIRRLRYDTTNTSMKHERSAIRHSLSQANNSAIATIASMAMPASASMQSTHNTTINPMVLTQARKVVARLYYEPSPEQYTPVLYNQWPSVASDHHGKSKTNNQSHTNMKVNLSQSRLSFSDETDIAAHPGQRLDLSLDQVNDDSSSFAVHKGKQFFSQTDSLDATAKSSGGILGDIGGSTIPNLSERTKMNNTDDLSPVKEEKGLFHALSNVREISEQEDHDVDDHCIKQILALLCTLGASYKLLCQYECKSALQLFHTLPMSQYNTGWVQHQIGKAYFEMADYNSAKRSFELMQSIDPHRMKGLELLSTALWHLKKEVELCNLAQRVVDFDRLCPESWCVIGNCFSLQKEHETALQFFRRSIQVDPTFTYSHTLSGHEYVSNEDFDRAASCYRDAIRVDERHYYAWYGLGAIYFRQEKYDLAEYHFRRALSINPQSSVLHCHLGMAQFANDKPYEALETLHGAFLLDPRNAQARYQRANIYVSLDKHREALAEYEKVRDAAPREANVHFAMGKVCKRLGWPERAMRCFLTALDLDPKDNNLIKAAMDRLNEVDIEEDISTF